jgi:flagellar protein FlaJ
MLLIYFYDKSHADWTGIVAPYDAYILAGIAALVPPAYYMYKEDTRIKKADSEFPLLLRELAQAKRAGLTLVDSFRLISEGEYGILTESLRTVAYQLTWGVPFEEALRLFAERHPTKMIKRSIELIIEGYRVGGDIGSILKITADDVNEVRALEKKRAADMMPYIAICYITFGVFLLILMVLYNTFIPMMSEASEKVAGASGAIMVKVDSEKMKMILFHCGMIQGFCSGFMAGKLGTGKVIAGLKHALLLALGAFALFAVLEFAPL